MNSAEESAFTQKMTNNIRVNSVRDVTDETKPFPFLHEGSRDIISSTNIGRQTPFLGIPANTASSSSSTDAAMAIRQGASMLENINGVIQLNQSMLINGILQYINSPEQLLSFLTNHKDLELFDSDKTNRLTEAEKELIIQCAITSVDSESSTIRVNDLIKASNDSRAAGDTKFARHINSEVISKCFGLVCALGGNLSALRTLQELGADVNIKVFKYHLAPVHFAIGYQELFSYLLEGNLADWETQSSEIPDIGKITPLILAAREANSDKIVTLLKQGVKYESTLVTFNGLKLNLTPLQDAMLWGNLPIVRAILDTRDYKENPALLQNELYITGMGNLLHLAVFTQRVEVLQFLLSQNEFKQLLLDEADIGVCHIKAYSPASFAAWLGALDCLELLLQQPKVIERMNAVKTPPLFAAMVNGQLEAVRFVWLNFKDEGAKLLVRGEFAVEVARKQLEEVTLLWNTKSSLLDEMKKQNLPSTQQQEMSSLTTEVFHYEQKKTSFERIITWCTNQLKGEEVKKYDSVSWMKEQTIRNLVIQGGGPKGFAYVSVLKAIEEKNKRFFNDLRRVAGTSAGAITALLISLGITGSQIETLMDNTKQEEFVEGVDVNAFLERQTLKTIGELIRAIKNNQNSSLLSKLFHPFHSLNGITGLCSGKTFYVWIQEKVLEHFLNFSSCKDSTLAKWLNRDENREKMLGKCQFKDLTFGHLNAMCEAGAPVKHLYMVATEIAPLVRIVTFNSEQKIFFQVKIVDAVRASMSIPGLFIPHMFQINGEQCTYMDGGILKNFPIDLFDSLKFTQHKLAHSLNISKLDSTFPIFNRQTLGICLTRAKPEIENPVSPPNTFKDTVSQLTKVFWNQEELIAQSKADTFRRIVINIQEINVTLISFQLDAGVKKALLEAGTKAIEYSPYFSEKTSQEITFNTNPQRVQELLDQKEEFKTPSLVRVSSPSSPNLEQIGLPITRKVSEQFWTTLFEKFQRSSSLDKKDFNLDGPLTPSPIFVGDSLPDDQRLNSAHLILRKHNFEELLRYLPTKSRIIITGPYGVGKTLLVLTVLKIIMSESLVQKCTPYPYRGKIYWIEVGQLPRDALIHKLCTFFKVLIQADIEGCKANIADYLKSKSADQLRCLIIFNNFDQTEGEISDFLTDMAEIIHGTAHQFIVTTRLPTPLWLKVESELGIELAKMTLEEFNPEETKSFYSKHLNAKGKEHYQMKSDDLDWLLQNYGRHPQFSLFVCQGIKDAFKSSIELYRKFYEIESKESMTSSFLPRSLSISSDLANHLNMDRLSRVVESFILNKEAIFEVLTVAVCYNENQIELPLIPDSYKSNYSWIALEKLAIITKSNWRSHSYYRLASSVRHAVIFTILGGNTANIGTKPKREEILLHRSLTLHRASTQMKNFFPTAIGEVIQSLWKARPSYLQCFSASSYRYLIKHIISGETMFRSLPKEKQTKQLQSCLADLLIVAAQLNFNSGCCNDAYSMLMLARNNFYIVGNSDSTTSVETMHNHVWGLRLQGQIHDSQAMLYSRRVTEDDTLGGDVINQLALEFRERINQSIKHFETANSQHEILISLFSKEDQTTKMSIAKSVSFSFSFDSNRPENEKQIDQELQIIKAINLSCLACSLHRSAASDEEVKNKFETALSLMSVISPNNLDVIIPKFFTLKSFAKLLIANSPKEAVKRCLEGRELLDQVLLQPCLRGDQLQSSLRDDRDWVLQSISLDRKSAKALYLTAKFDKAEEKVSNALVDLTVVSDSKRLQLKDYQTICLKSLAGRIAFSKGLYRECEEIYKQIGSKPYSPIHETKIDALFFLGRIEILRGRFELAYDLISQAEIIQRRKCEKETCISAEGTNPTKQTNNILEVSINADLAKIVHYLGFVEYKKRDYEAAAAKYEAARQINRFRLTNPSAKSLLSALGLAGIKYRKGYYDEALADLIKLEVLFAAAADELEGAKVFTLIAKCHFKLGNFDAASAAVQRGKSIFERFQPHNRDGTLNKLVQVEIYAQKLQFSHAESLIKECEIDFAWLYNNFLGEDVVSLDHAKLYEAKAKMYYNWGRFTEVMKYIAIGSEVNNFGDVQKYPQPVLLRLGLMDVKINNYLSQITSEGSQSQSSAYKTISLEILEKLSELAHKLYCRKIDNIHQCQHPVISKLHLEHSRCYLLNSKAGTVDSLESLKLAWEAMMNHRILDVSTVNWDDLYVQLPWLKDIWKLDSNVQAKHQYPTIRLISALLVECAHHSFCNEKVTEAISLYRAVPYVKQFESSAGMCITVDHFIVLFRCYYGLSRAKCFNYSKQRKSSRAMGQAQQFFNYINRSELLECVECLYQAAKILIKTFQVNLVSKPIRTPSKQEDEDSLARFKPLPFPAPLISGLHRKYSSELKFLTSFLHQCVANNHTSSILLLPNIHFWFGCSKLISAFLEALSFYADCIVDEKSHKVIRVPKDPDLFNQLKKIQLLVKDKISVLACGISDKERKFVGVFCTSTTNAAIDYCAYAVDVAKAAKKNKYGIVYGGSDVGLMKHLADTMMQSNDYLSGDLVGVVTNEIINLEYVVKYFSHVISAPSYTARKNEMIELADCFIILPGGYGTLDELAEVLVINQFASFQANPKRKIIKPIAIIGKAYYTGLMTQFDTMWREGCITERNRHDFVKCFDDIDEAFLWLKKVNPTYDTHRFWENHLTKHQEVGISNRQEDQKDITALSALPLTREVSAETALSSDDDHYEVYEASIGIDNGFLTPYKIFLQPLKSLASQEDFIPILDVSREDFCSVLMQDSENPNFISSIAEEMFDYLLRHERESTVDKFDDHELDEDTLSLLSSWAGPLPKVPI